MQSFSQLPSLFYLLANHGLVSLDRLVRALRYQAGRGSELSLSFAQILVAFNDVHHNSLTRLRDDYGELDEDPIGHLMVDMGHLSMRRLQALRARLSTPTASISPLLATGPSAPARDALLRDLEALCQVNSAQQSLQLRYMAMTQFKQKLLDSALLDRQSFDALGIWDLEYVPLRFKPLLDVLVLNGEWPGYLTPAVLVEHAELASEPLLRLLCRPGLTDIAVLSKLMYLYDPASDTGINPAVLLERHRLLTRGFITHAVAQAYTSLAGDRLRTSA